MPARIHRAQETVEWSRFIATLGPAASVPDAKAFIAAVGREFPDATHNCWAFVVGPPGDTSRVGMSDAGEPRGTAGRPILNALLGSGVGDIAAVVTRYYGGIKLGTGGLARAYSGCVMAALTDLPTIEKVATVELSIIASYSASPTLRRLLEECGVVVVGESFAESVTLRVRVPEESEPALREALGQLRGQARIESRVG